MGASGPSMQAAYSARIARIAGSVALSHHPRRLLRLLRPRLPRLRHPSSPLSMASRGSFASQSPRPFCQPTPSTLGRLPAVARRTLKVVVLGRAGPPLRRGGGLPTLVTLWVASRPRLPRWRHSRTSHSHLQRHLLARHHRHRPQCRRRRRPRRPALHPRPSRRRLALHRRCHLHRRRRSHRRHLPQPPQALPTVWL